MDANQGWFNDQSLLQFFSNHCGGDIVHSISKLKLVKGQLMEKRIFTALSTHRHVSWAVGMKSMNESELLTGQGAPRCYKGRWIHRHMDSEAAVRAYM